MCLQCVTALTTYTMARGHCYTFNHALIRHQFAGDFIFSYIVISLLVCGLYLFFVRGKWQTLCSMRMLLAICVQTGQMTRAWWEAFFGGRSIVQCAFVHTVSSYIDYLLFIIITIVCDISIENIGFMIKLLFHHNWKCLVWTLWWLRANGGPWPFCSSS